MFYKFNNYHSLGGRILLATLVTIVPTAVSMAGILGSDSQLFNPAVSSRDYSSSQSATPLGLGRFSLGVSINHAYNSLPYFADTTNKDGDDTSKSVNDTLTSGDLLFALGLTDRWDIGLALPYVLDQQVRSDDKHGEFVKTGNTGIRAATKFLLLKGTVFRLATSGTVFLDRTQNNPYLGSRSEPLYAVQLIPEVEFGRLIMTLNLGYRWRKSAQAKAENSPVKPLDDQTIASAALGFRLTPKWDLMGEVYGSRNQTNFSSVSPRSDNPWETLVGGRYHINRQLTWHIGATRKGKHSLSTSDLRLYTSLYWTAGEDRTRVVPGLKDKPDDVVVVSDILFNFNSAALNPASAEQELTKLIELVRGPYPLKKLVIEGHTCSIGGTSYNAKLSRERAESVRRFLFTHFDIPLGKTKAMGFGESHPIASNRTPQGRKMNRRVEFKVFYDKSYKRK